MDGFQRRKELKKRNILEAALALFIEFGVKKISISEIARKANVSQVTIYNYFESKDNLVHHVFHFYIDKTEQEFVQILKGNQSFPEKIKQIMFNKNEQSKKMHEDFYLYIMNEYSSHPNELEELYKGKAIPLYIELFEQGKKEGYIDPALSNEAIIFYLHAMNQYIQQEDVYLKVLPLIDDILNIFFYGVMGKR